MFPGFFPWGNPYYSPWGKPCGAQSPLLSPLGKTLGSPLGKTPRKSSDSRPPGFPPWGKVCISPGGQGPPGGIHGQGHFFFGNSEMGKQFWENPRAGSERNGNPMPLNAAGLGFYNFQGPPWGKPRGKPCKNIFGELPVLVYRVSPLGKPLGKSGPPPWGKVGAPPLSPLRKSGGHLRTHGENPTENPG